jgi:hypothetical protein
MEAVDKSPGEIKVKGSSSAEKPHPVYQSKGLGQGK